MYVPDEIGPPPDRWSWSKSSNNVNELLKLDVPPQLSNYCGLELWNSQEITKREEGLNQSESGLMDIALALDLRPAVGISASTNLMETIQRPELSGELIRSKIYICSACGQIFQDFQALLDHQQAIHIGVYCTHIELQQSTEVAGLAQELTRRQIIRSAGSGEPIHSAAAFQCTKCHLTFHSIPELHRHILLCSNHVTASPYQGRRIKVNPISRRGHWSQNEVTNGGLKKLQRSISSKTKHPSTSRLLRARSPKEGEIVSFLILTGNYLNIH